MRERPSLGYRVIGAVDSGGLSAAVPEVYEGVPVISDLAGLPDAIRESGANEVIIADSDVDGDALFDVMMRCGRRRGVEFRVAPSLINCLPSKTEVDQIGALPMIRLFREPLSDFARVPTSFRYRDRRRDAPALSPFWFMSLCCKARLVGRFSIAGARGGGRRIFLVYKFRTMRVAPSTSFTGNQRKFISGHAEANVGDGEAAYKLRDDPRITRFGRVLLRLRR